MAERIEKLQADHLDECAHLLMTAFNAEPWNDSYALDTAKKQLAWHLRVPGCVGLVSANDEIVAFAVGYREPTDVGDVFNLSIFCVKPDLQRTGVGTRLLRTLEERLRQTGVRTVYLGTRRGTPAEAFYAKHGYGASAEDIEMSRDLDNSGRGEGASGESA
jgi:aminoglycoside 6'-N-acetyltransferase I